MTDRAEPQADALNPQPDAPSRKSRFFFWVILGAFSVFFAEVSRVTPMDKTFRLAKRHRNLGIASKEKNGCLWGKGVTMRLKRMGFERQDRKT